MIILDENFKWHLEAFASELFIYMCVYIYLNMYGCMDYEIFINLKITCTDELFKTRNIHT